MTPENATDFFTASNQKTIMDKEEQKTDKKPDNIPGWSIPYLVFLNHFGFQLDLQGGLQVS